MEESRIPKKVLYVYTDLVQKQIAEKFPETHTIPHRNLVRKLGEKFRDTDSVLDCYVALCTDRSGGPSKLNDKKSMDIYNCIYARGHHFQHNL
jgi:hypothetical protein